MSFEIPDDIGWLLNRKKELEKHLAVTDTHLFKNYGPVCELENVNKKIEERRNRMHTLTVKIEEAYNDTECDGDPTGKADWQWENGILLDGDEAMEIVDFLKLLINKLDNEKTTGSIAGGNNPQQKG